ncbi:MBL fold metallo-hydrolase [Chloroflexota bacterium]
MTSSLYFAILIRGINIFLIMEEEITVIDTGLRGSASAIAGAIGELGRSVEEISLIIITHNHIDHIGGLPELRKISGARVAIHRDDLNFGQKGLPYRGWLKIIMKAPFMPAFWPSMYATEKDVDIVLQGGEVLKPLGGLEVIPTPGHTPGGISLYSASRKLIFVGDTINHRARDFSLTPPFVSSDMMQARQSVKRLAQLDFEVLCYGHGKPLMQSASARLRDWIKRKDL